MSFGAGPRITDFAPLRAMVCAHAADPVNPTATLDNPNTPNPTPILSVILLVSTVNIPSYLMAIMLIVFVITAR
jgi:hypothetical protein